MEEGIMSEIDDRDEPVILVPKNICPKCGAEMEGEKLRGRWHLEAKCSKCDYTCSNYIGPDDGPGTWA